MTTCAPLSATASLTTIVLKNEAQWGVFDAAADALGMDFSTDSLQNPIDRTARRPSIAFGRSVPGPQFSGLADPGGAINGSLQPNGAWPFIFRHALGSAVSTRESGSLFQHVLLGSETLPVGFSIEKRFGFRGSTAGKGFRYTGCRVNDLNLRLGSDGKIQSRFTVVAGMETPFDGPFGVATYPASNQEFTSSQAALYADADADGEPELISYITDFNMTLSNTLGQLRYSIPAGPYRRGISAGFRRITGTFSARFDAASYDLYQRYLDSATFAIRVTLRQSSSIGVLSWDMLLPSIGLRGSPTPQVTSKGAIRMDHSWMASFDEKTGSDCRLVIHNADPTLDN